MQTVRSTVVKSFPYSHDGFKVELLRSGDVLDVRADLFADLKDAGLVEHAPDPAEQGQEPIAKNTSEASIAKGPAGLFYVMKGGDRVSKGFRTEDEALASLEQAD